MSAPIDKETEKEKQTPLDPTSSIPQLGEVIDADPKYASRWRYSSPFIQVLITSLVAFGCPGMFNSLSGIGGGGQLDTDVAATGNIALYAVGAGVYLFIAPIVYHYLGPRWCMFFGGMAYPLYGGSLLAYNHIQSSGFVIAASAILGVGSSVLWVAQGAVMTSAPLSSEKGLMVGLFWFIFNMGGVIGDFISMGINWDSTKGSVSDATYAVFIALMGAGFLSALSLINPKRIVRSDGSRLSIPTERPNVIKDFLEILKILPRKETILMIPYFMMANYFYSYQQNTVNARMFDVRTRSFNGSMYWFAQMIASPLFGWFLDNQKMTRRRRGLIGFAFIVLYSFGVWGGGLAFQLRTPSSKSDKGHHLYMPAELDMIDSHAKFAGPFVLYFFYGAFDAIWQTLAYWLIGCMGNDELENQDQLLARYVGLYKSMQAVGSAVSWKINAANVNYDVEFALDWGLVGGSLFILAPIFFFIREPRPSELGVVSSEKTDEEIIEPPIMAAPAIAAPIMPAWE